MQAQGAAQSLAASLGQEAGAEHLLIALLDQGTPGVTGTLTAAGLDAAAVRRTALAAFGAPAGEPPIPLPALAPAGTMDRPPLPVTDLDARAWTALQWRQEHLPLSRLRGVSDWQALIRLERAEAGRIADRLSLDDDQRYSLISHHIAEVEQHGGPAGVMAWPHGRRRLPWRGFRNVTVGWAVWFGNRRVGLQDRWFRLRTIRHYRGAPRP